MKFIKDILIIEIESTGQDPDKDPMLQLSAVRLDKDNLLEKGVFNTYIRVSLLENTIAQHAGFLGISPGVLQKSPKPAEAIKKFSDTWKNENLLLCCNLFPKLQFLKTAYKKAFIPFEFDQHVLELWTLGYIFTNKMGLKKMSTLNTLIDHFKIKVKNPNNSLERARVEAEILRKII